MQANQQADIDHNITALYDAIKALPDSKKWLVALSGGADSTALLHLLAARAKACGAALCAVIVNHNLREEAAAEAQMVKKRCAAHGISATVLTVTAPPPQAARQEWARARRYELLCSYARRHGGVLWFAHHCDDQTETVAMRLSHDSGLAGLGGMRAIDYTQGVPILRPLLGIPKQRLMAFCDDNKLAFVKDPSNEDRHYERVRWRTFLAAEPTFATHLSQLAITARAIEDGLWRTLYNFMDNHVHIAPTGLMVSCDFEAFKGLLPVAQMAVMRRLLALVGAGGYPAPRRATMRLIARLLARCDGTLAACLVRCEGNQITILPEAGRAHAPLIMRANQELYYRGRFFIRTPVDMRILPMNERRFAAGDRENAYRQALSQMRPEIRLIFPYLEGLDGAPITPHIKDMVQMGHFSQMDWPYKQVAIHPLGRIATKHML